MPVAGGGATVQVVHHYQDHDTDEVDMIPPVQNTWYEVFDAEDVRLIWCYCYQKNDEAAAKDVEIRWTIDGNVYFSSVGLLDDTDRYVYRNRDPSAGGTEGLSFDAVKYSAAYHVDKRGHRFKVEIRMTEAVGTNQILRCRCVRETLEET